MVMSLKQREIKIEPRIKLNHIKALLHTFGFLRCERRQRQKTTAELSQIFDAIHGRKIAIKVNVTV